ncbi:MAG: hypothetical protein AAGA69_09495 [Pseudomonadota bacterium]
MSTLAKIGYGAVVTGILAFFGYQFWWQQYDCGVKRAERFYGSSDRLEACAARGHPEAMFWSAAIQLADSGIDPDDASDAITLMQRAARAGSSAAMNEVGLAYLDGTYGLKRDLDRASFWLRKATDAGDAMAPLNLARLYLIEFSYGQDLGHALKLVELSADRGSSDAQCILEYTGNRQAKNGTLKQYMEGYDQCDGMAIPEEFDALGFRVLESDAPGIETEKIPFAY